MHFSNRHAHQHGWVFSGSLR